MKMAVGWLLLQVMAVCGIAQSARQGAGGKNLSS
jgi:hypothetical protein